MKLAIGINRQLEGQKALTRLIKMLRAKGLGVGGAMIIRSRRSAPTVLNLATGEYKPLLSRPGKGLKFHGLDIDLNSLSDFASLAIDSSVSYLDVTVFHEIEPLELLSTELRRALERASNSEVELVFTYKLGFMDPLVDKITSSFKLLTVEDMEKRLFDDNYVGNRSG